MIYFFEHSLSSTKTYKFKKFIIKNSLNDVYRL